MAPRKNDGEGKGKRTTAVTRQTRSMVRKTRSQTQRNSFGGSSSSSKLMTFESPEKRQRKPKAKEAAGPSATKKTKQEKEEEEPAVEEEAKKPEEEEDNVAAEEGEGDDDSEHKKIVIEHCKIIGVESSRNRDAVTEDRISELPEALLLQILSLVPTKQVIATSVLSKRWRSVWKMVPKLKFESEIDHVSAEDVYRLLLLHKAPVLESLHLKIEDTKGRLDIGILIGLALSRHVRKLVLDFYNDDQKTVRFPSELCGYNNTLEVLDLISYVLLDFPSRVCFNALRELRLDFVEFKDEASVCNLLSGCPRLQDLFVDQRCNLDVETYTIDVPSLQRLTIQDTSNWSDTSGGGYVINAPSLKYLNIQSLNDLDFFLMENAPELVQAKIENVSDIANENILASLTSAKRISLHLPVEIKYPTGIIFFQLVSLELHIVEINGWNRLSFMLDSSPKLQSLKLSTSCREDCPAGWEWNPPKCVPECLLLHLETLVWRRYGWQREDAKQVATYILKNARQLKKATFFSTYVEPKELEQLEKRREILNELASVARVSNSCHLVFETR